MIFARAFLVLNSIFHPKWFIASLIRLRVFLKHNKTVFELGKQQKGKFTMRNHQLSGNTV
ncbi:hypothetical protein PPHE_a0776 [Pseudoalteromonas phenolica O-BC30]|nr:hypothetical protein [Pseudoalteromonas phenolica O-BC30]